MLAMLLMFAIDSLCCLYRACFNGIESGVEETSVTLADDYSTKSMDSDVLMLSMSYGSLRESSEDGDYSSLQDHVSSYEPT